jgi:hypothetical protein
MDKPDRAAYARRNARWLVPVFVAVLIWGVVGANLFAVIGGVFGLVWVGGAFWMQR